MHTHLTPISRSRQAVYVKVPDLEEKSLKKYEIKLTNFKTVLIYFQTFRGFI